MTRTITLAEIDKVMDLKAKGKAEREIALQVGICRATTYRIIKHPDAYKRRALERQAVFTKSADQQTEYVDTIAAVRKERDDLEAMWLQQGLTLYRYQQALRDALHALETAQGLWVTNKAAFWSYGKVATPEAKGTSMSAAGGTYWRQSFAKPIAKIKAVLGENPTSPSVDVR